MLHGGIIIGGGVVAALPVRTHSTLVRLRLYITASLTISRFVAYAVFVSTSLFACLK